MHVSCLETNENEWYGTYIESMQWIDLKAQFFWSEKGGNMTKRQHFYTNENQLAQKSENEWNCDQVE